METEHKGEYGSFKLYLLGFTLSILLTLAAYFLVDRKLLTGSTVVLSIMGLGIVQAIVQLILFLHLGDEPHPRWNLTVFLFMALVAVILIFGSLWIMYNISYALM